MSADGDRARPERWPAGRWLAIVASVVVLATVVAAVLVMGPPAAQREASLDNRRVQDLAGIVGVVELYYRQRGALPPDLATLAGLPGQRLAIADPVDGSPYVYQVAGQKQYRLCAVFVTDTAKSGARAWGGIEWNHAAGRQCFDRRVGERDEVD